MILLRMRSGEFRQPRLSASLSLPLLLVVLLLVLTESTQAIKFSLPAYRYPPSKCIWNNVHTNQLVIVTANVGPGANQRVDIEIIDSSSQKNVYLSKKGIKGETRLAVTAHAEGEVGVCFKNYLEGGMCYLLSISLHGIELCHSDVPHEETPSRSRVIDLEVDIGADAIDYKYG